MDNEIKINITHGKLESFSVKIGDEDEFNMSAVIGLYTDQEKRITSFSIDTRNYYGEQKFDLPINTITSIQRIAKEIELVVIRKCREGQKALPSPNE